jgi:hypothetical protein
VLDGGKVQKFGIYDSRCKGVEHIGKDVVKYRYESHDQVIFFFLPGEYIQSADIARASFLRRIKQKAPQVLSSLATLVYPTYEKLWDLLNEPPTNAYNDSATRNLLEVILRSWLFLTNTNKRIVDGTLVGVALNDDNYRQLFELEQCLHNWSTQHYLTCDWVKDSALRTLGYWSKNGLPEDLDWFIALDSDFKNSQSPFSFVFPEWNPQADTWKSYNDKVQRAFTARLLEYKKEVLAKCREKGVVFAKETYAEDHFTWLVEFQINCKPMVQIAREHGPLQEGGLDRSSVSEAIHKLASLIDLSLRPSKARKKSLLQLVSS